LSFLFVVIVFVMCDQLNILFCEFGIEWITIVVSITDYMFWSRSEKLFFGRQMVETEKHYRNGFARKRHVTAGCGNFSIHIPRLRELFSSAIVDRYQQLSLRC
jgi:hypothetical protein